MRTVIPSALALLIGGAALAARFTDTFDSHPGAIEREPFMWSIPADAPGALASWSVVNGALQYRTEGATLREATALMWDTGVDIADDSTWSLEVAFRHVEGEANPLYEAVLYVRWDADIPGHIGLICLAYDAAERQLLVLNGGRKEEPIPTDLRDEFHAIRVIVEARQARVYLDGRLVGGPYALSPLETEWAPQSFMLGPITGAQKHTLCCQWDYFAFTDDGAFAPGDAPGWDPSADGEPVSATQAAPDEGVDPDAAFDHPPYANITVLPRMSGPERFSQALPEEARLWEQFIADKPGRIEVPLYRYEGETGPSRQNVYRGRFPLRMDDRRHLAMAMLTRGIDDTVSGYMDYKLWYCVSTDGGHTYDEERPVTQRGDGYSAMHPVEYVWIGKNSFCFATLQFFMVKMSNGQVFLPCYYAPLDENGEYYNPLHTSTYSNVFGLIGTWNEAGDDVLWDVTDPIALPLAKSTGGVSECAVIELTDKPGHIFMVIRAGNEEDRTGKVPCWKWKTLSTDYGKTWSELTPFTFSDGTHLWSPTAQSNLIRSSRTGKVYWIGNLTRVRPRAGWPRYPLVIGELDEETLGLRKETVSIIDDCGPGDASDMQLSNFSFLEDAATGHILVMLSRLGGGPGADGWQTYEIQVR